jgi:hypothetical protein
MNPMHLWAPLLLALLAPVTTHADDNVRIGVI